MKKQLRQNVSYLTISDIHTFHRNNETEYILESATVYFDNFSNNSPFCKLDIIFIAGDLFDDRKDFKSKDVQMVLLWMQRLMAFCKRNKIKLRILEGTPSHDYRQSVNFESIAIAVGPELDYKYIDALSIEWMTDLDINVLYMPDEWLNSAKKSQEQVEILLRENNLQKVDIACMHGMFDFQLPEVADCTLKHDSAFYLGIVRYFINIGHVHIASSFERIIVQGSFDRISHGEEGKKGGVVCNLKTDLNHTFTFVENKRARIFKTIQVKTMDLDKGIAQVRKALESIPDKSFIRIMASKENPILTVVDTFKASYPGLTFKKEVKKDKQVTKDSLDETITLDSTYTPISITEDNIVSLIMEQVRGNHNLNGKDLETLEKELSTLCV